MEIYVPGFIHNYCTPNAMLTLAEYLRDYASESVKEKGWKAIANNEHHINRTIQKAQLRDKIERIKKRESDLFF